MPIDSAAVLSAPPCTTTWSWSPDEVILYQLAIGAGTRPTDPEELAYTYEPGLKVLPTFATQAAAQTAKLLLRSEGMSFDPKRLLQGEQEVAIHRPIPTSGEVHNRGQVIGVYDKGSAAIVVIEVTSADADGQPLFSNRLSFFIRGEGGFGGSGGPPGEASVPDREHDLAVYSTTLPQQALLFRLCGDKNPLHADPALAKAAGFERPILHGLCTYGIVCKAVVDAALGGDLDRIASYRARFAGSLYPGETVVTSLWRDGGHLHVRAQTQDDDRPLIKNGLITIRS